MAKGKAKNPEADTGAGEKKSPESPPDKKIRNGPGEDTFMYHPTKGAYLFRDANPSKIADLEKKGWKDHPAPVKKTAVEDVGEPD